MSQCIIIGMQKESMNNDEAENCAKLTIKNSLIKEMFLQVVQDS